MLSFLEIFFAACLGCSAWTYRPSSRNQISADYSRTIPSHQISTPRQSPTSVSSRLSLMFSVSNSRTTARLPHNGEGVRLHSVTPRTAGNQGWITIETVFIQLNTSLTPSGHFPAYWNESLPGKGEVRLGYDAAVCVQKYEPWIIEAYNSSTGSSFALRIVEKGDGSTSAAPSGNIRGAPIANTRYLNATGKDFVFSTVHNNSVTRFWEANDYLGHYSMGHCAPTPTVGPVMRPHTSFIQPLSIPQIVSFTEGTGLQGYVELSPDRFAAIRARADAVNVLPYLAGSGAVVAQSYRDETLAFATYKPWQLIALPILVWILGVIGELFVPALPLKVPRREFGVYSWLALFRSQARGLNRIPCTRTNRQLTSRSYDWRRLMVSISS